MTPDQAAQAKEFLAQKTKLRPKLGFVLGSGLSGFAQEIEIETTIPFGDIPHFAVSTVAGHPGKLLFGRLQGVPIAVLQGRLHAYEGLTLSQVVFPIRVLAALGLEVLMVSNAAGGLNAKAKPGDFMLIRDQINMTGDTPLRGPNYPGGPRFVDMTEPYDKKLALVMKAALKQAKVRFYEGVYVGVMGPSYETAAEVRCFARLGGGAVGMSTVAEVLAARHLGLRVVGLSCITNLGTGLSKHKLTHEDVKDVAGQAEAAFARTLKLFTAKVKSQL